MVLYIIIALAFALAITMFLNKTNPPLSESIVDGMNEPVQNCISEEKSKYQSQ